MANNKREKPKHLGRGLASLFDPITSDGAEAVLKSGPGMPSAETEPQMPEAESGLGMPSAETEPQIPEAESEPGMPSAETEPQMPEAKSSPGMPSAETVLEMLKTKSELGMLKARSALEMLKTRSVPEMFGSKTALGIDISNGEIKLALLKKGKNGLELLKAASSPVPDGAIKDGNIEDAAVLAKAIKELKKRSKIGSQPTVLSLVADPILIEILEVPKDVPGSIRQFIQDEVKHYAKLPIQDAAIDFCGIKSSVKSGVHRALVVATDGHKISESSKALNQPGLNIDAIEPALVAYIRACYAKKIAKRFDRNLLLAIVHEGIVTFCLFRNETLDFVRTKRPEADKREPDKCYEWLAEQINAILQFYELEVLDKREKWEVTIVTDIYNESIEHNTEALGTNIEGAELAVRSLEDAYLDTPVADTEHTEKPSAIAVGLAMKLLNFPGCNLNIDFLPREAAEVKTARKQTLVIANAAAVIFLLMILSIGFFNIKVRKVNENIKQQRDAQLRQNVQKGLNEQTFLDEQIADITEKLKSMNAASGTGALLRWGQILNDIRFAIPKTARITNLSNNSNSKILLEGQALSYEAVHLFVDMLNAGEYIESASLTGTKRDNRSGGLLRYSINCSLIQ
jgi:Tfp pilus assembly protein PilN